MQNIGIIGTTLYIEAEGEHTPKGDIGKIEFVPSTPLISTQWLTSF